MATHSLFRQLVACLAAGSIAFSGMAWAAPAPTPLISTEAATQSLLPDLLAAVPLGAAQAQLQTLLQRNDLAAALQARGVSPGDVRQRVASLTDAEARDLLNQIDQAPAGGDILGVLFTVFVVLLVTDLLGLTHVFPFTSRSR